MEFREAVALLKLSNLINCPDVMAIGCIANIGNVTRRVAGHDGAGPARDGGGTGTTELVLQPQIVSLGESGQGVPERP